jgi:hypothetical protein
MAPKADDLQISAIVSRTTKELLEGFSRMTGLKKGYLIEEALRHHLLALQELPDDVIVPPVITLTGASFKEAVREIESPAEPAPALRKLLSRRRGR